MILKRFLIDPILRNKLNSMTKYPSILTLHKLGDRGTLLDELTDSSISNNDTFYATEKIDGTNVRIILHGDEFIIGSRENLLYYSKDMLYDPAQGIVDAIKSKVHLPYTNGLIVIYGELYGGNITSHSNWYGKNALGFRVFDICDYDYHNVDWITMLLTMSHSQISRWREHEEDGILKYSQPFMTLDDNYKSRFIYEFAPTINPINIDPNTITHLNAMTQMKMNLPETKCKLSEAGSGNCEGIVIRTADRSKIYKLRFEDYQKTLNKTVK